MMTQLYRHFDSAGTLLYVGISKSTMVRLAQHADHAHWFDLIAVIKIETFDSREAAIEAEAIAIVSENPLYNIQHKVKQNPAKHAQFLLLSSTNAKISRADLTQRVVQFNVIYSPQEVAKTLGMRVSQIKQAIDTHQLGILKIPSGSKLGYRRMISGWQLISYIEHLEAAQCRM